MLDVEFVSELFILTMHGIQDGKTSLDNYYAIYDDEIPDEVTHKREFRRIVRYTDALPIEWRSTRFRNLADLYSLWAALLTLDREDSLPDAEDAVERLLAFEARVVAGETTEAQRYLIAARQGSNKDTNRELRKQAIEAALRG